MNNFNFCCPTNFVFGRGVEEKTGELLRKQGAKRILIVYGGGSVLRSGLLDKIQHSLSLCELQFTLMGGVQPNPLDDKVREGIELAHRENIDFILAVGGGSVIDTAKAIAVGVYYEGDFWDFYENKAIATQALPLGVVLTIPAAGSEGSGNSIITNRNGLKKLGIRYPDFLRPKFAVMNPELTYTLPFSQTAAGITDMMAHIMERYFSNTEGVELTDRLCEGTLRAIMNEAHIIKEDPNNYDARANIMWAGTIAHNGICGVGREEDWGTHFMEHEISAMFNVTHGAGLAVMFPAWLTWGASHHPQKIAQFAHSVFDVPSTDDMKADALEGIRRLKQFFISMNLPTTLAELGIKEDTIDTMVANLHRNKGQIVGAYIKMDANISKEIFEIAK